MNLTIKKINKKFIVILSIILSVILISNLFVVNVLAGVHAYPLYDTDVYAGPSDTLYPKSGSVFAGEQVYVVFAEDDWGYISYNITSGTNKGKEKGGYVKLSSINNTYDNKVSFTEKKEAKSKSDQNVYTGKGENHVPVGSISRNETVWILMKAQVEINVYKYFIEYKINGTNQFKRGWVSIDSLEEVNSNQDLNNTNVDTSNNAYKSSINPFTSGQCTWLVYGRAIEKLEYTLPNKKMTRTSNTSSHKNSFRGNARTWWWDAIELNMNRGQEAKANSIAVFENGSGTGHVVFVEKIDGDTIWFNEANHHKQNSYDGAVESQNISDFKNRSKAFLGFIYLE